MTAKKPIVLTAGGTGGHMFPAKALAAALVARGHRVIVITDARGIEYLSAAPDLEVHTVPAASPAGGLLIKFSAAVQIGAGILAARGKLRRFRPAIVIGFGGYPAFPAMVAATRAGLPTLLHEQNALLGRVNRWLAPRVTAIATSFPETAGLTDGDIEKVTITGNPVRDTFAAVRDLPYSAPDDGPLRLLVTGGSQGARIMSDVVPAALASLDDDMRIRLRVTQQCRDEDLVRVEKIYADAGITADLATFIDNIPGLLATTHLAIMRAGASSAAEIMAAGRPAILVPYMHAADDHQAVNARALADKGAAWMMRQERFTELACRESVEALLRDPRTLRDMAKKAHELGRVDAAERLADLVEALALGGDKPLSVTKMAGKIAA